MSLKPDYNEESYRSIIISSFSSAGFWSVILSVTGVIAIVFGGAVNLAFEDLADVSLWVLLAGALSVFVSIILSPRAIAIFLVGRRGRYGTNVAIMTIAFFIIMLVINYFLYQNPNRIDVTATRIFSLSSQTLKILDTLPSDVTANAFFAITSSDNERQQTDDLLNEFARRSDKFSYRFIDPELDRAQAIRYNVTNFPTVVFEENTTGKLQHVAEFTEQEFVTGILISTGVEQKKIYYLTGHGEAHVKICAVVIFSDDHSVHDALLELTNTPDRLLTSFKTLFLKQILKRTVSCPLIGLQRVRVNQGPLR